MEIGGFDLTFKTSDPRLTAHRIRNFLNWPNSIIEQDQGDDYFLYKDIDSKLLWDIDIPDSEQDRAAMIHFLIRENELTLVVDGEMVGKIKEFIDTIQKEAMSKKSKPIQKDDQIVLYNKHGHELIPSFLITYLTEDKNKNINFQFDAARIISYEDEDVVDTFETEHYLSGYVKWDGCCNWWFGEKSEESGHSTGYIHFCGPRDIQNIRALIKQIYLLAEQVMGKIDDPWIEDVELHVK